MNSGIKIKVIFKILRRHLKSYKYWMLLKFKYNFYNILKKIDIKILYNSKDKQYGCLSSGCEENNRLNSRSSCRFIKESNCILYIQKSSTRL